MIAKITSLSFCVAFILLSFENSFAQDRQSTFNLYYFSKQHKSPAAILEKFSSGEIKNHPEYGMLPADAPCTDCVELLDKRTGNTRQYKGKDNISSLVYNQQSYNNFNYVDGQGWWREINSHISPDKNNPKVFSAMNQLAQVVINMEEKYASITYAKKEFRFNKNLQLYHIDENGKSTTLGTPDWSHFSAGDDGVTIKDFYPGIDAEMIVSRGKVETNFILNHRLSFSGGYLVMKEDVEKPDGFAFDLSKTNLNEAGQRMGKIELRDADNKLFYKIENGLAYDASTSGNQSSSVNLTSSVDGSALHFYVPMNWLNDEKTVYPVVIDPVQAADSDSTTAVVLQGTITGSGYSATCPMAVVGPGCIFVLNMVSPAYTTIIDVLYSFDYRAIAPTWLQQGGFSIDYLACSSPAAGANTCPIPVPGVCARHRQTIYAEIAGCIPPPSCPSYAMAFTMHLYRCVGAPVGCTNTEIIAQTDWSMTVIGRFLELDFVNPDVNICLGACTDLTASGSFGVPPYTFHWTPPGDSVVGNLTPFNVCPLVTTQYTCMMTDACTYNAPPWESNLMDDSSFVTVNVGNNVNPGFTMVPANPCIGENVTITGLGAGAATDYNWDIVCTGGTFNNSQVINLTFPASGNCDITLHFGAAPCISDLTQTITVDPDVVPSVTNTPNPLFPICPTTCVTFTAVPTNGGTTPAYQWQVNGGNVGLNSDTYTDCTLSDLDVINVIMTSNAHCAVPNPVNAQVVASVLPPAAPTIIVSNAPAWPICAGDNVTFTTVVTFPGTGPLYQWTLNTVAIAGATNDTYSTTTLNNGDIIACNFTSNDPCAVPPNAVDTVLAQVYPITTPTVTVTPSVTWPVCEGTPVTFTATDGSAGTPTFQWYINSVLQPGATSSTFTPATLVDGDDVSVIITSSNPCPVPPTATDNEIADIILNVVPAVLITPVPGLVICAGTPVTFTATPTNGGTPPAYQWQVNGINVGINSDTYTSAILADGDIVSVTLTSSEPCPVPPNANDQVVMTVNPNLVPSIDATISPLGCVCPGTQLDFTTDTVNAGSAPVYQWTLNGNPIGGATGSTYSTTTLANGDIIGVVLTSNALCVAPPDAGDTVNICILGVTAPTINVAPVTAVCSGTNIDFFASATDTGATPTYQWYLNNWLLIPGATNNTYSDATLSDGDLVRCLVTSSIPCALPDTSSNFTTVTILAITNPLVDATSLPNNVCFGTPITFTAAPSGVGLTPTYQWYLNGVTLIAGATDITYTDPGTLIAGDYIGVVMTSTDPCPNPAFAADTVIVTTIPLVDPDISISLLPAGPVCEGTQVDFSSVPLNEGTAPIYQWQVNGVNVGINSSTFSSTILADGDIITVMLTSNAPCAIPPNQTSNQLVAQIVPYVTPAVTIVSSATDTICPTQPVTFSATPVNGGGGPLYDWYLNGVLMQAGGGNTFTSAALQNGDVVGSMLTANNMCQTSPTAISNLITTYLFPELTVVASGTAVICPYDPVTLLAQAFAGSPAYVYNWSDGSTGDSVIVHPAASGYFNVTATDNCPTHSATDSVLVNVRPIPNAQFSYQPNDASTLAPDVDFTNLATGYFQYMWYFGDGDSSNEMNPTHTYATPGAYDVTLWTINALGCIDEIVYRIIVKEDISVFIPNCFTPNGDSKNESFTPIGASLDKYSFIIYNRWGTPIFHGDEETPWRGYAEDGSKEPVPNDVYVYRVDLGNAKFNPRIVVGRVSVVR